VEGNQHNSTPRAISASQAKIIVVDDASGETFERTLPIEYYETDNGILLRGENLSGEPVTMVFLSSAALSRIKDVTGAGPDEPRENHSHEGSRGVDSNER